MFSASPVLTLDRYRLFLPLPPTSVSSVPSALKSTFKSNTPLASAGHSPQATIPFRIISFAYPHHLTPIESYSCKKQGRGWYPEPPTQPLPLFSTASKHPTHSNARLPRARARHTSTLFMCLPNTSPRTRGGGLIVGQAPDEPCLCRPIIGRTGYLRYADHRPRSANQIFSARLRDLCVSALSFSRFSFQLSTVDCQPLAAAFPLLTTHYSLLTVLPITSTLPPPNYGIIPPHRGVSRSSLTTGRNPIPHTGRIQ